MPALDEIATPSSNLPVSPDLYYYFQHFFLAPLGVFGGKRINEIFQINNQTASIQNQVLQTKLSTE
ncbi:MAG: hypothetical protein KKH45_11480 [Proteobacteria bacterium]|nr:hypothetical protein [Pseudomonadota bacterium]